MELERIAITDLHHVGPRLMQESCRWESSIQRPQGALTLPSSMTRCPNKLDATPFMTTVYWLCRGGSQCNEQSFFVFVFDLKSDNFVSFTLSMNNNNICYNWNGTVSTDVYCGLQFLSTCCGPDWDCLSNGLCRQHGTTNYTEGSCTEPKFQSCVSVCNQCTSSHESSIACRRQIISQSSNLRRHSLRSQWQ